MKTGSDEKQTGTNRRQYPRVKPSDVPGLKSVELSQGVEIDIVNISRGGMLLETGTRLGPDCKIVLKVTTNSGPLRIDGVVLRSSICSLKGRPLYRSAVQFKKPFELLDESVIIEPDKIEEDASLQHQSETDDCDSGLPAVLTVMQGDDNGLTLTEEFSLNNW